MPRRKASTASSTTTTSRECKGCGAKWETSPGAVQLNVNCPSCGHAHSDLASELEEAQKEES